MEEAESRQAEPYTRDAGHIGVAHEAWTQFQREEQFCETVFTSLDNDDEGGSGLLSSPGSAAGSWGERMVEKEDEVRTRQAPSENTYSSMFAAVDELADSGWGDMGASGGGGGSSSSSSSGSSLSGAPPWELTVTGVPLPQVPAFDYGTWSEDFTSSSSSDESNEQHDEQQGRPYSACLSFDPNSGRKIRVGLNTLPDAVNLEESEQESSASSSEDSLVHFWQNQPAYRIRSAWPRATHSAAGANKASQSDKAKTVKRASAGWPQKKRSKKRMATLDWESVESLLLSSSGMLDELPARPVNVGLSGVRLISNRSHRSNGHCRHWWQSD